ncbi:MAG: FlgD immunoglobulin-like domain containing protein [Candidatus Stygibacter australis]|nr:FlgD immunoglobulin-like domain containing protein [Candidatus Stygibacter australis]
MRYLLLYVLILFALPVLGQLEWGDGIEFAESSNTLFGDLAMLGDIGYFCWIEDYEDELCLKVQGFDSEGNSVWEFPVIQSSNDSLPGKARIGISEDEGIFMLWQCYSADVDIISNYIQKLDFGGNKLWGENGIEIINTENECVELLSDGNGGMYLLYEFDDEVTAWHYNETGELVTGWEEGIYLGNHGSDGMSSSLSYTQKSTGELITFTRHTLGNEPGVYFQEYNFYGEMEYPDQGLFIDEADNTGLSIVNTGNDEYLLSWHQNDMIAGNKFLEGGELLFDEAMELYEGDLNYIYNIQLINGTVYLILSDNNSTVRVGSYDDNWQELTSPDEVQISYDYNLGVLIKDNSNILIYNRNSSSISLTEYDCNGNLLSPEEGWINYHSLYNNLEVSTSENVINLYWKQYGQLIQTIYDEGEILYEEPRILGSNRIIPGDGHGGWQTEEKLVFCCRTRSNEYFITYLSEDGDILYDAQIIIDNPDLAGSYIGSNDDNGFYLIGSIENEEGLYDDYLFRIDTTNEPELVWGNSGLYLRPRNHPEQGFYNCQLWDNLTLFFWYENEETIGQLSDGNEFLWESGGIVLDNWLVMGSPKRFEYIDGYLRYNISNYPERYTYVNRLINDFDPVWEEPVLLNSYCSNDTVVWFYYDYVSGTELLTYWVERIGNDWRLKKQTVTESGEKLCGEDGIIILETDNEEIREILADENNDIMGVVTGGVIEPEITYFTLEGEPLGIGTVCFPEIYGQNIDEIILKDGYVVFFTRSYISLYFELQIWVYDLGGNFIPELPSLDYSVDTRYQNLIFEDEEAIYFTYNHKHHEEDLFWLANGGSGIDIVAQKFSLPNVSVPEEEIQAVNKIITVYPNPFNPEVTISFDLPERQFIELDVYNTKGQHVKSLAASEYSLGRHEIIWKGENNQGAKVSSGLYYLKLQIDSVIYTEKVVMIK